MIGRALGEGVRSAMRRPGLVALLWAWNLALALLAGLPFWAWVSTVSSLRPATDVLLDGFDVGVITQLMVEDGHVVSALAVAVAGLAIASLVSGAFLSGGILEIVMAEGDGRPLLHRFFCGAGHFFGRFLRLLVIAGVTTGVVVAAVAAAAGAATRPLSGGGSEPGGLWASVIVQAAVGLTLAFFVLALDYARVMTVSSDSRSMLRTWGRAMLFVIRHTPGVATIGLLAVVGVVGAMAVAVAYDVEFSARTWGVIAGAVGVHQAMIIARTAVRVGQIGAQASYCAGFLPVAAIPANDECEPGPPVADSPVELEEVDPSPLPE